MTPILANVKLKWLLFALLVLVVCKPAASCGTRGNREQITVSVARGCW